MTVCLEASFVVKLLALEPDSGKVSAWFADNSLRRFVSPSLMPVEVASALRRKVLRGLLTEDEGMGALGLLVRMGIEEYSDHLLLERAMRLAYDLGQPTVYDCLYIALAERERCEVLTADKAFAEACSPKYPFVRAL